MVEWVQPKSYQRFELGAAVTKTAKGIAEAGGKTKSKKSGDKKPGGESPASIEAPPKTPAKTQQSKARPHPGKAGEIGPVPPKSLGPGPRGTGPRALGSRTVDQEEAGRQARAELVQSVMDKRNDGKYSDRRGWRNAANLNTGAIHTGEVREQSALPAGGAAPLGLPTRQSASTERLQTQGRRDQTREIPRVGSQHDQTIDFQAVKPSRTPFAMRTPPPLGSGRSPEQLAMFHVPGSEPTNPSLSTRQQSPIAMPSASKVSKLSARPTPGKAAGDQGVLFQPARYRSVH